MKPTRRLLVTLALAMPLAGGAEEATPAVRLLAPADATAPMLETTPTSLTTPNATATVTPTPIATPTPTAATTPPAPPPAPASPRTTTLTLPSALEVEVHGRLYTGLSADERDGWSRQLGLREARVEVEARLGRARTVVEADLASRETIKDAYLRLDLPAATRLTAGRFKAPFSERQLASSWKLPLVVRGLVDDYVVELNGLGGRRLGAEGQLNPWNGRVQLAAGVFASDPTDANGSTAEDAAARVAVRPWNGLEVGASAYRAAPAGPGGSRREAGAAHVKLEVWAVDATLEGMAGTLAQGKFAAATALASVTARFRGGRFRVAPVAGAEVLELRDGSGARGHAVIGGAVLSWLDGLKVKVQGERARRPGDEAPANALAIELGTKF